MIMDREKLVDSYIEAIIDGMDHKMMYHYVRDNLYDHLKSYSEEELRTEILDYYPHVLGEDDEDVDTSSELDQIMSVHKDHHG